MGLPGSYPKQSHLFLFRPIAEAVQMRYSLYETSVQLSPDFPKFLIAFSVSALFSSKA